MPRRRESEESTVITDARSGRSKDLERRQRNYVVTMSIRTACFFGVVFAPGVLRWICLGGAIVLPWIAVMFVNQVDKRGLSHVPPEEMTQLALPSHHNDQVITGEVSGDTVSGSTVHDKTDAEMDAEVDDEGEPVRPPSR